MIRFPFVKKNTDKVKLTAMQLRDMTLLIAPRITRFPTRDHI